MLQENEEKDENETSHPTMGANIRSLATRKQRPASIFNECQITRKVVLPITAIGKNISEILSKTVSAMVCNKCIVEGFVKDNSVQLISFSSGLVKGNKVVFDVMFKCKVFYPVTGMHLKCVVKNVTKAGVRAVSHKEQPSPFVVFVARDHFYENSDFNAIQPKDVCTVSVIAQRFELNDPFVSIIAEIVS